MAKQGMHKHDARDPRISRGHNKPKKSTNITTGPSKKRSTYRKQALAHEDTAKQAQDQQNEWADDTRYEDAGRHKPRLTKRDLVGDQRTGSDSNEDSGTRGH
ncbi:MAG TPA: hypothetical protein VF725_01880 [Ktedonobacterales bacterium]